MRVLTFALAMLPGIALAQSYPSPTFNTLTVRGGTTLYDYGWTSNVQVTNPTGERYVNSAVSTKRITTTNAQDVLGIISQMGVDFGANADTSQHTTALYGHTYGQSTVPGGSLAYAAGVIGMSSNQGKGTVTVGASFMSHIPVALSGGGLMTSHYAFFDQGCTAPTHATACYGAYFEDPIGVGVTAPTYAFQDGTGLGMYTTGNYTLPMGQSLQMYDGVGSATVGGTQVTSGNVQLNLAAGGTATSILKNASGNSLVAWTRASATAWPTVTGDIGFASLGVNGAATDLDITMAAKGAGNTQVGSGGGPVTLSGTTVTAQGPVVLKNYTVGTLPTCNSGARGSLVYVTDATAPLYNAALTGGSNVVVPAFCNGSAWTSH